MAKCAQCVFIIFLLYIQYAECQIVIWEILYFPCSNQTSANGRKRQNNAAKFVDQPAYFTTIRRFAGGHVHGDRSHKSSRNWTRPSCLVASKSCARYVGRFRKKLGWPFPGVVALIFQAFSGYQTVDTVLDFDDLGTFPTYVNYFLAIVSQPALFYPVKPWDWDTTRNTPRHEPVVDFHWSWPCLRCFSPRLTMVTNWGFPWIKGKFDN